MGVVDRVKVEVHETTDEEIEELVTLSELSGDAEEEHVAPEGEPEEGEPLAVEDDDE